MHALATKTLLVFLPGFAGLSACAHTPQLQKKGNLENSENDAVRKRYTKKIWLKLF